MRLRAYVRARITKKELGFIRLSVYLFIIHSLSICGVLDTVVLLLTPLSAGIMPPRRDAVKGTHAANAE